MFTRRPFVRACLFQPGKRGRIARLVREAGADAHCAALLQAAAPVEAALQAAQALEWDRCLVFTCSLSNAALLPGPGT